MKLYILEVAKYGRIGSAFALFTENGEVLYRHLCSSAGYAPGDLIHDRPERVEECTKRFGEYQVLFLGDDDLTMEELLKRNRAFYEQEEVSNE